LAQLARCYLPAPEEIMIRHFFLTLYDHLGQMVILNLLWVVAATPWMMAGFGVTQVAAAMADALAYPTIAGLGFLAAAGTVVLSPATLFVVAATQGWARGDQRGWRAAWTLTYRLAWRAQAGGLLTIIAITLLLGNALFYQSWAGWFGLALSGVMLWLVVALALMGLLLFPVLVDNPQLSVLRALRHCSLLVLGNVRAVATLGLASVICLIVGFASGVGLVLGAIPATALVANLGLVMIMQRYGGQPLERDSRGLRDLLRPWQT
jgi:uncharacterized membrane protein YesL